MQQRGDKFNTLYPGYQTHYIKSLFYFIYSESGTQGKVAVANHASAEEMMALAFMTWLAERNIY